MEREMERERERDMERVRDGGGEGCDRGGISEHGGIRVLRHGPVQ